MTLDLDVKELDTPSLEFGGTATHSDPKVGLDRAGPYDLRFGGARKSQLRVGLVGPQGSIQSAISWLDRCQGLIAPGRPNAELLYRAFPGFEAVFRCSLEVNEQWQVTLDGPDHDRLGTALREPDPVRRFNATLREFSAGLRRLAERDANRPDVVMACLPDELLETTRVVSRDLSLDEKRRARQIKEQAARVQLDMFDVLQEVEQTEEDLLTRDFRDALKAEAMRVRMPIQIGTNSLFIDGPHNQDAATRAWNSLVALYYKSGGVPWRLANDGPETCFVGISFHHFRTNRRSLVRSSLAQAFSSEGEGFALRGDSVPWERGQGRNVHLTETQAYNLALEVLNEYRSRTGTSPLRIVVHKTSSFNAAEQAGIKSALDNTPIVEMITLLPSPFRLLRFGGYPPNFGTICRVNDDRTFLFTSGYMPELGTYPGPHVPQPFELRSWNAEDPIRSAQDVLGLTRMNWNTADIRGKWPVTMSFARRIGSILDEFGDDPAPVSSFRYFL